MKPVKKLFVDVETTGLDAQRNGVIEICAIAEIDHVQVDTLHLQLRPFRADEIDPEALEVNGYTEEVLRSKDRMGPKTAFKQLMEFLDAHIDKFDKEDKFTLYAHSALFDMDFLIAFFKKNDCQYYGSYITYHPVCTLALSRYLLSINASRITGMPNLRLESLAKEFGDPIEKAHHALHDCKALYKLWSPFEDYLTNVVGS
jgi:DNA polymerase III epsilon subunit-like protein